MRTNCEKKQKKKKTNNLLRFRPQIYLLKLPILIPLNFFCPKWNISTNRLYHIRI